MAEASLAQDSPAVCSDCGWHAIHGHECWPEATKAVNALAAAVPISSTKLGYGPHRLTFLFGRGCTLTLEVFRDGGFQLDKLTWRGDMSRAGLIHLTQALARL